MLPGCHERTGHGEGTPGEEIAFPSQLLIPFEGLSGTSSRYFVRTHAGTLQVLWRVILTLVADVRVRLRTDQVRDLVNISDHLE